MKLYFMSFVYFLINLVTTEATRINNFYPAQVLLKDAKSNATTDLFWSKDVAGRVIKSDKIIIDNFMKEIQNTSFRVLLHQMDPYLTVDESNGIMKLSGFIGELWNILQTRLLFRSNYELVTFDEGKKIIEKGDADIMLSPYIIESADLDSYDISIPITTSWYEMYIRSSDDTGSSSSYMVTFSNQLWIAFICTLALFSFLLWGIPNFRKQHGLDKENERTRLSLQKQLDNYFGFEQIPQINSDYSSLVGSCLVVLGSMAQQGVHMYSRACSVRVVLFVILLFSSLMFTSYSAMLVSRLAVGKLNLPFNDIESIPGNDGYSLCVRTNSHIYDMFTENISSNRIKKKWKPLLNQPPCHKSPTTVEHIASSFCNKHIIIVETRNIMSGLIFKNTKCQMIRINSFRYATAHVNILIRKNFTYTYLFKHIILRLHASGLIHLMEQRCLSNRKPYQPTIWNNKVTIGHIKELLFLYSYAIIFSILLVFVERIVDGKMHTLN